VPETVCWLSSAWIHWGSSRCSLGLLAEFGEETQDRKWIERKGRKMEREGGERGRKGGKMATLPYQHFLFPISSPG